MRVIAHSQDWYLLDLEDGRGQGQILDLEYGRLFAPMQLVSLLSRGGWEDFTGDASEVLAAVEGVEHVLRQSTVDTLHVTV